MDRLLNVWVAGKTVLSLVNTCQPERFRDEDHTHTHTHTHTHIKRYTSVVFTLIVGLPVILWRTYTTSMLLIMSTVCVCVVLHWLFLVGTCYSIAGLLLLEYLRNTCIHGSGPCISDIRAAS